MEKSLLIGVPPGLVGVEQGLEAFLVQAAVPAAGEELTGADGAVGAGQEEAPALLGLAGAVAAGQAGDLQERLGLGGRFVACCLLIDPAGKVTVQTPMVALSWRRMENLPVQSDGISKYQLSPL